MTRRFFFLLFFCLSYLLGNTSLSLILPQQSIQPGSKIEAVVEFDIEEGWHLYWKNPGEVGLAPNFDWTLPEGISVTDILWPSPSRYPSGATMIYGYSGNPQWIVRFAIDENVATGSYPISLSAFWLTCNGSCVPDTKTVTASLAVSEKAPPFYSEAIVENAKKELPQPIYGADAHLNKKTMTLSLPVEPYNLQAVLIIPEQQGLFPVDSTPTFQQNGKMLDVSIELSERGVDTLLDIKWFCGLVQLISATGKKTTYELSLNVDIQTMPVTTKNIIPPPSMWFILLFAFLGGIILNITPCALPVVGIRLIHIISSKEYKPFSHGLAYTFGILVCFWILAALLYSLEYVGSTIGWGFQLQEPYFVATLIIILFILAMSLFGIVEIGYSLSSWASETNQSHHSLLSSFTTGLLATVVATPCTGPLLGSVLGFAITFHVFEGFILFTAIALGMAFPFLLVSIFPSLIKWIPKPGPWLVTLKQFFGFLVVATIIWLLWVLQNLVATISFILVAFSLLFLAFGTWIYGHYGTPIRGPITRAIGKILALALILLGSMSFFASFDPQVQSWVAMITPQKIEWEEYSESRLQQELNKNNVAFVKFTAKWCLTCQTNELTFMLPSVARLFQEYDILPLKADWTDGDPEITEKLRSLGRNGVPVYAIFKRGAETRILSEILTPEELKRAFEEASAHNEAL